jgi:hypothetical protein
MSGKDAVDFSSMEISTIVIITAREHLIHARARAQNK